MTAQQLSKPITYSIYIYRQKYMSRRTKINKDAMSFYGRQVDETCMSPQCMCHICSKLFPCMLNKVYIVVISPYKFSESSLCHFHLTATNGTIETYFSSATMFFHLYSLCQLVSVIDFHVDNNINPIYIILLGFLFIFS